MRMEAAVAADYAQQVKYRGDRVVKAKIKGDAGPPMANEAVEEMNEMAKEIRVGSNKGRRIAYLRKWAKDLDDDLTYEEVIDSGNNDAEPEPEAEASDTSAEVDTAREERLAKLKEQQANVPTLADFKKEMAEAKTFQERMAVVRKQALEASQAAAAKAAELDEYYQISEQAAAAAATAKVQAGEVAAATKEQIKERAQNYKEGKGFTIEVPEGMERVRIVTVKECFMRSDVVDCLIVSFLKEQPFSKGSRVLVPGCGLGHEVLFLARLGYEVTAVDFAQGAIEGLRSRIGELPVSALQKDIFSLPEDHADSFDVVLEHTCFCAIPLEMRSSYAAVMQSVLKHGGRLVGLFYETDAEEGPPFRTTRQHIVDHFEKHFEIKFKLKELIGMKNVGDMIDLILQKKGV